MTRDVFGVRTGLVSDRLTLPRPAARQRDSSRLSTALRSGSSFGIIAEIKRRSPSSGDLSLDLDAVLTAEGYEAAGASAISVLTDRERFGGSLDDLRQVALSVGVPVLRKDFIKSHSDIHDSYREGADAVLLIYADLLYPDGATGLLSSLMHLSITLGMEPVIEVSTAEELEAAMLLSPSVSAVLVNQRNSPGSHNAAVQYDKAIEIAEKFGSMRSLPDDVAWIAASGIGTEGGTDLSDVAAAGYDAALIGEALVTAADPAAKLNELATRFDRGYSDPRP